MLKTKKGIAVLTALSLLAVVSSSVVYASTQNNDEEKSSIMLDSSMTDIMTSDRGGGEFEYSLDNGDTWINETDFLNTHEFDWTPVTEEDLLKEIEEIKANLADPDFMSDWVDMGYTEQHLQDNIRLLEQDIEDLRTGKLTELGRSENVDGTQDMLSYYHDPNMVSEESNSSVTVVDESSGLETYYEAPTDEELCTVIELAYENGKITKEARDEILAKIK